MKTIKDQFCSFEIAKELKDLGFDEPCFGAFNADEELIYGINIKDMKYFLKYHKEDDAVLAPLHQQIIDWFREKHDICIMVSRSYYFDTYINSYTYTAIFNKYENKELKSIHRVRDADDDDIFHSYNEARKFAILKAIELIKSM